MDLKSLLNKENPFIVEIGCNDGTDTANFYNLFSNPTVLCFEPGQKAIDLFKQKKLKATLFEVAVSDINGVELYYPSNNQDLSGSICTPTEHMIYYPDVVFEKQVPVISITLDDINDIFPDIIDLVWMDVQGAEWKVIAGGLKVFNSKVKYLHTEFSNIEVYEGAPTLDMILELLPDFELVEIVWQWKIEGNALLRNKNL